MWGATPKFSRVYQNVFMSLGGWTTDWTELFLVKTSEMKVTVKTLDAGSEDFELPDEVSGDRERMNY